MREKEFNNIKKIGVISDTHIPARADKLPEKIFNYFKDVDLILHAGDLVELNVLEDLQKISPVVAVKGNMDRFENVLPEKAIIKINNKFKIGLYHGNGTPIGLTERIKKEFDNVNCIIFGHTHHPFNGIEDNVLLFNPGSACDTVFTNINSVGILHINKKIRGEILKL